eukprot:592618-Ditylum_brightwellii.AAC.1
MEILSSMSAEAKWALINCMKKLSLHDFEGEDVNTLSTIILGVIKRLTMLMSVPKMRISGMQLSPEDICNIAEQNYCAMKLAGEWDGVSAKAMLLEDKDLELEKES